MKLLLDSFKAPALLAGGMVLSLLTGCAGITGIGTSVGSPSDPIGATVALNGTTHGGYNPIAGATVTIYAAGSNFGTATALAKATSAADGTFSLYYSASSANNDTTSSFYCPSSNTQMYLVSSGGNTTGTSYTTGNSAVVLMTALGPCSGLASASSQVIINEVTTVGMAFAMGQFMSVSGSSVLVGAPANVAASTTVQGSNFSTGLANAYNTFLELVVPGIGEYVKTTSPGGAVTMTGTPEYQKIVTMANILSVCVNQTNSSGSACTNLFNDVAPPSEQTQVSSIPLPTSFPTSVAQAAYYLAINPAQTSTLNGLLYGMLPGTTPFTASDDLSAAPNDWTVAIVYSAGAGTCTSNNLSPFNYPQQLALDTSGDVWVANGASTVGNVLAEVSPNGKLSQCLDGAYIYGHSVAVDRNDNVWYTAEGTSTTVGTALNEVVAGGSTITTWTIPSTYQPYNVVMDKAGDVIVNAYNAVSSAYPLAFYADATDTVTPFAPTTLAGTTGRPVSLEPSYYGFSGTSDYGTAPTYLYGFSTTSAYWYVSASGTPPFSFTSTQKIPSAGVEYTSRTATDKTGMYVGASEGANITGAAPYSMWFKATPGSTSAPSYSAQFAGGMNTPGGTAVDGANDYWSALEYPVATGVSAFAAVSSGLSALSPNGPTPASCAYNACLTGGGFQLLSGMVNVGFIDTAVDASGNVWGLTASAATPANAALVKLVGAAAPMATPLVNSIY